MAISIPIVSEWDGRALERAKKEFAQLEGVGAKAQYAIKKAAIPAAAALGAVGVALFDATKGAMEDAAAQTELARSLKQTTGATDAQVAATEDWISTQGQLLGVADDQLRPALAKLGRATMDVTEAQKAAKLAMDISAATGKDLDSVTTALAKAYGGNLTALQKLDPSLRDVIKGGASLDEVMQMLGVTFDGAATSAANTAEGGMKRLSLSISETKESIGAALLPAVEAVLPYLLSMANWAQQNPQAFLIIAGTISSVAAAIMAVNVAMALNPFGLIAVGIGALVTGLAVAYTKFEGFRNIVRTVINGLLTYFEALANAWITVVNTIIKGINLVKPGKDIGTIGSVTLGRIDAPTILAPPSGADISRFDMGARAQSVSNVVNINVNGGDPQAVVNALRRYQQTNGAVPIRTTG